MQYEYIKERFLIVVVMLKQILGISDNGINIIWYYNNRFLYLSTLLVWAE